MLSRIFAFLADPADQRTIAAFVVAILVNVFGDPSSAATAVVDAGASLITAIDVFGHHVVNVAHTKAVTAPAAPKS